MSLDRSLKGANALVRHRNVLTRFERLNKLKEEEKWTEAKSVFGLPKVAHRKQTVGGKAEKEEATDATATAGAAAPANHTTVRPGSHAGGPMIAPSTTRSAPMSSAMPVTVAGDTALAST